MSSRQCCSADLIVSAVCPAWFGGILSMAIDSAIEVLCMRDALHSNVVHAVSSSDTRLKKERDGQ